MKFNISVVIPVYNGEKFIARAIESVLAQTYKPFEIIVINDGSKDGTLNVLKRFEGMIRYKTVENGGASNARNAGVAMATGEWVAFLDADDIWRADKLEHQVKALTQFPEAGFCCCDYTLNIPDTGKTANHFKRVKEFPNAKFDVPVDIKVSVLLFRVNFVGTCSTVVMKTGLFRELGGFNVNYKQSEDFDLWIRCAMRTKFIILDKILVEKFNHSNNLTSNRIENHLCHKAVLKDLYANELPYFKKHRIVQELKFDLARKNYQLGDLYFRSRQYSSGCRCYCEGLTAFFSFTNVLNFSLGISKSALRAILRRD